jgi:hypothetical protein
VTTPDGCPHDPPASHPFTRPEETTVTATLRLLASAIALVAGLCVLTASAADLPKESQKKATAADILTLQKYTEDIVAEPAKNKKLIPGAKALVLILGTRGDPALAAQATTVGKALEKKDYKAAAAAAQGLLSPKAEGKAVTFEYDLNDVMAPFRLTRSGGLNIEKDIKDAISPRGTGKIEPAVAELIGARTAPLADIIDTMPNDKAKTNSAMTAKWSKFSKDMAKASKELTEEGGKGDKADPKKLIATLKKLDASCSNCHNEFRD